MVELMITVAIMGIVVAIAVPSGMKAAQESRKTICINNLRLIRDATQAWALMNNANTGDVVVVAEVNEFLKRPPECPMSGTYDYGTVGDDDPTCSLAATEGHILPPE